MSTKNTKQQETEEEYQEISLFKNPISTFRYLILILTEQLIRFVKFLISNKIILLLAISYFLLNFGEGPHKEVSK
jgi:hypothetical protein